MFMNLLCVHILKHVFINIHINIKIFSYKNAFDIKLCCAIWRDAMVFKSTVSSHRRPGIVSSLMVAHECLYLQFEVPKPSSGLCVYCIYMNTSTCLRTHTYTKF